MNRKSIALVWMVWIVIFVFSCWADVVIFQNEQEMEVEGFRILDNERVELYLQEGSVTVPTRWIKRIVLKKIVEKQPVSPPPAPRLFPFQDIILQYSRDVGLDWRFVVSVIDVESGFNPWVVSPRGAVGLMQLLPDTAGLFGVSDLFDPRQNIFAGTRYLAYLFKAFQGDVELVLAAYNAGPVSVERYGGIPPFRETQQYVEKVLKKYDEWIRLTEQEKIP